MKEYRAYIGLDVHKDTIAVVAPRSIPCKPGDRVKTDRRDAPMLARVLGPLHNAPGEPAYAEVRAAFTRHFDITSELEVVEERARCRR